jgi:hypothetical protein
MKVESAKGLKCGPKLVNEINDATSAARVSLGRRR